MPHEETTELNPAPAAGAPPALPLEGAPPPEVPPAALPPPGGLLFRYRNAMGVALALLLVLCQPWSLASSAALAWTGGLLILAGVSLRLWCILQIGGSARKT